MTKKTLVCGMLIFVFMYASNVSSQAYVHADISCVTLNLTDSMWGNLPPNTIALSTDDIRNKIENPSLHTILVDLRAWNEKSLMVTDALLEAAEKYKHIEMTNSSRSYNSDGSVWCLPGDRIFVRSTLEGKWR